MGRDPEAGPRGGAESSGWLGGATTLARGRCGGRGLDLVGEPFSSWAGPWRWGGRGIGETGPGPDRIGRRPKEETGGGVGGGGLAGWVGPLRAGPWGQRPVSTRSRLNLQAAPGGPWWAWLRGAVRGSLTRLGR